MSRAVRLTSSCRWNTLESRSQIKKRDAFILEVRKKYLFRDGALTLAWLILFFSRLLLLRLARFGISSFLMDIQLRSEFKFYWNKYHSWFNEILYELCLLLKFVDSCEIPITFSIYSDSVNLKFGNLYRDWKSLIRNTYYCSHRIVDSLCY